MGYRLFQGLVLTSAMGGVLLQTTQAAAPIDFSDLVANVAPAVVRVTVAKN